MDSDPYSTYKSTQIETASKEKILLMLYEGLIKYVRQAKNALENDKSQMAHDKLLQSQEIVTELISTLDMDVGGEIAEELYSLYDYMLHNLIQANVENDPSRLEDILPVIEELNEAWDEVINEKGMTLEKARRKVSGQVDSESSGDDQDSPDVSGTIPDKVKTPDPSGNGDDSFDGNVTYGDI
jgi:flagellar protein FliS